MRPGFGAAITVSVFFFLGFVGKEHRALAVQHQPLVERDADQILFVLAESAGGLFHLGHQRANAADDVSPGIDNA